MKRRVLSGMRPTGQLHLGHLCGVLANWRAMQETRECFFFVADWHALTTDYAAPADYAAHAREMVLAWLAAGVDPARATLFVQSQVPAHAELHVLLSMICPLPKLMQLPTYKEQRENLNRDLDTYGFLGYPLLQSADILAYRAQEVPVGEDQLPHIEFTREVARRFNHFYGGGDAFRKEMKKAVKALPAAARAQVERGVRKHRQGGDEEALAAALAQVDAMDLAPALRRKLRGYCIQDAEEILPLPQACLTPAAKLPGTDGRKMSKSYDNTIALFDAAEVVDKKIARMVTDPARKKREDKGEPKNCPVWELHENFSPAETQAWAESGCRSAEIGCIDCKKRLAEHLNTALQPLRDNRRKFEKDGAVEEVLRAGNRRAAGIAADTLADVRRAMRLTPPPAAAQAQQGAQV